VTATPPPFTSGTPAIQVLGRKLDSIPFSAYHVGLILVLGLVGFVEGYDLALGGSLIVLAKGPLNLTGSDISWLVLAPTLTVALAGLTAALLSDRLSRKTIMQIGVVVSTFFTLLIPLARTAEQLIVLRILTGIGLGYAISAPFPIAAELLPAQHRRTYGAIYEVMLASAFTLLPFISFVLAGNSQGFRLIALPGGLALFVVPVLLYFALPDSPRWLLRRGQTRAAIDAANLIIARAGNRVAQLTVAELGSHLEITREQLPPFTALFRRGQLRWTTVGIFVLNRRGHLLLRFRHPDAEGAGRSRCRRRAELWTELAALHGEHSGQVLHWIHHGNHRSALGDHLCARRSRPRPRPDGVGASGRVGRDGRDERGSADHGFHRAVFLPGGAGVSLRAVPDRAARARALFRRVVRASLRRRGNARLLGSPHRLAHGIFRHLAGGGGDRRLRAGAVRQGDRRPTRIIQRGHRRVRLTTAEERALLAVVSARPRRRAGKPVCQCGLSNSPVVALIIS
jgi:Major Facilitator Superfamily